MTMLALLFLSLCAIVAAALYAIRPTRYDLRSMFAEQIATRASDHVRTDEERLADYRERREFRRRVDLLLHFSNTQRRTP